MSTKISYSPQHYCEVHAKLNKKMENSTPCKIVSLDNIILKRCIRDYVGEITQQANFGFNRTVSASPQIGEILPLFDFLDCPVLTFVSPSCTQVELLDRFSRFMAQTTCFCARMVLLGVRRTTSNVIWGKYVPQK